MVYDVERFLEYLTKERKYSLLTVKAYRVDIYSFNDFVVLHNQNLAGVDYDLVRLWIVKLSSDGLSNRTINRKLSSLKSFYKFLQQIGSVKVHPMQLHRSLKIDKTLQVPFSRIEIQKVRQKLRDEGTLVCIRDLVVIDLLYLLGLRRSELVNLKLGDFDFSAKQLRVLGKGDKVRYLPILDELVDLCLEYLDIRASFIEVEHNGFVVMEDGNKINEMFVYRLINGYFSNVTTKEKKSPHMLRHSFASHLIEEGADINSVKELMGHESLATTSIYTQVNLQELKKAYQSAHPRRLKK